MDKKKRNLLFINVQGKETLIIFAPQELQSVVLRKEGTSKLTAIRHI